MRQLFETISVFKKITPWPFFLIFNFAVNFPVYASYRPAVLGCEKKLAIELRYQNLVVDPVKGLYDSIPLGEFFKYDDFIFLTRKGEIKDTETGSDFRVLTEIFKLNNKIVGSPVGSLERWFSKNSTEMNFTDVRFQKEVPNFVNISESIPLVKGRGIPTQAFMTLMQMKIAGVPYGGLTHVETSAILNYVTSLELIQDPTIQTWIKKNPRLDVPDNLIADAILKTSTGRSISTVLAQSGHRIDKIKVSEVKMAGVYDFPTDDEMEKDAYISLLRKGLTHRDEMPIEFRLSISLSPISK